MYRMEYRVARNGLALYSTLPCERKMRPTGSIAITKWLEEKRVRRCDRERKGIA
jgi:hypothetical protein